MMNEIFNIDSKKTEEDDMNQTKKNEQLAAMLNRKPRTRCFSEANAREISKLAQLGATLGMVCDRYQKTQRTIRKWLFEYYQRPSYAKKAWELLNANSKKFPEVDAGKVLIAETVVMVHMVLQTQKKTIPEEKRKVYVLDSQIIQRKDGRDVFDEILCRMKKINAKICVHSLFRMKEFSEKGSGDAKKLATRILADPTIEVIDEFYLTEAAKKLNAVIVTNSPITANMSKKAKVPYKMVQEFTAERGNVIDESPAREITIPVCMDKKHHMISELDKVISCMCDLYRINFERIKVVSSDGRERKSPNGKIRLYVSDRIILSGYDGNSNVTVTIEVTEETTANNCLEINYKKVPTTVETEKKII